MEGDKLHAIIGSNMPYAEVHDKGEFIKSKGKMHTYFWAMYYKTQMKNPFFKWMALSVLKKGGVQMPHRPYFTEAMKFLSKFNDKIFDRLWIDIMVIWNS